MTISLHQAASAAPPTPLGLAIAAALRALGAIARGVRAWLEAGRRAASDRDALASMSDRELKDIGLHRASASAVTDGMWVRDYQD